MTQLEHAPTEQSARVLAELGQIVLSGQPLPATLQRIAEIAVRAVPGIDETSVTLVDGPRVRSVVFTGQLAIDLDERQYADGFGPCLDAAAGAATVVVDVADPATPYADFSRACRRRGVAHVMSIGLPVQQQTIGALNLYARAPEPIGAESVAVAEAFAAYCGVAVANATQYDDLVRLADQMRQAMASRAVIEQAKGILMARHRYSADAAFTDLTRISQRDNRKLREVAAGLVAAVSNSHRPLPG